MIGRKKILTGIITLCVFVIISISIVSAMKYVRNMESFESSGAIKVHFNAFWPGFMEEIATQDYFIKLLSEVYGKPVIKGSFDDSDILMESVFGDSVLNAKKWKHSYLYSCEAYLRSNYANYTVILSGQETGNPHNNISLPCYTMNEMIIKFETKIPQQVPKKDVVCIISNPGGEVRNAFLTELDKHFKVDYAGKYKNNIGGPLQASWGSKEFADFISNYKFVISMENNKQPEYITEKILHGIRANNIPVYWGGDAVERYINPKRFIHLKDKNDVPRVIDEMKYYASNDEAWLKMVSEPWKTDNQPTFPIIAKKIRELLN